MGLVPHGGWSRITEFLAFSKSLLLHWNSGHNIVLAVFLF